MRQLSCPSCRDDLAVRDLRPGRFRIACPRCSAGLILTVPADPALEIGVAAEAAPAPVAVGVVPERATPERPAAPIQSGWLGRYRVVGSGQGRAWGVGPAVDLSVIPDRWATDPRYVAAWTLEALAAIELRHPNLAVPFGVEVAGHRVHAVGASGTSSSLADPAMRGSLDRQGRVAATLHAARGLRSAHEQGVYHRDFGPGSIRPDARGSITVAGLGVGLTPTLAAPPPIEAIPLAEPASAPAPAPTPTPPPAPAVVGDLVGLGRVLSTLVAGASGDRAVPPGLAGLIRRLGGGDGGSVPIDPLERYRDLGAVVRALESELGVGGPLNPPSGEVEAITEAVADYHGAPLTPIRRWVGIGASDLLGLIILLLVAAGKIIPAIGWGVFGLLVGFALIGFRVGTARHRMASRFAPVVAVVGRRDLITLGVAGLLGFGTLWATQFLVTATLVAAIALGLAAAFHFGVDRPLDRSRAEALGRLEVLVEGWRRLGFDEDAIRRYIASVGGPRWEEMFAELFGFDAVTPARERWGATLAGGRRPRFAPIRAWLLGQMDRFVAGRSAERTRGWLAPILERDFEARGTPILTARRRSKRAAEAVVAVLGQYRRSPDQSVGLPLADALRKAVAHPEEFLASPEIAGAAEPAAWRPIVASLVQACFGTRTRFLLGAACLAGAFVWMEQNALVSYEEGKTALVTATVERDRGHAIDQAKRIGQKFVDGVARVVDAPGEAETMNLGLIPLQIARHLNGFALAASALILLGSSLIGSTRIIPFALAGALIPLTPRLIIPSARPLDFASLVAMTVGLIVFAVGVILNRGRES